MLYYVHDLYFTLINMTDVYSVHKITKYHFKLYVTTCLISICTSTVIMIIKLFIFLIKDNVFYFDPLPLAITHNLAPFTKLRPFSC